jgi:transposase
MAERECPGCRERDEAIADLRRRVAELESIVRDLTARLGQNASNSSVPPSANPPGAPRPVAKTKTGRRPGGQPGHPAHLRRLLPPERVTRTEAFVPDRCDCCRAELPAAAAAHDPPPARFQRVDLPDVAAVVTEYQGHARTCARCGVVTRAAIPAAVRAHSVGPRLSATLSYLTGCHGVSRRGAEEIAEAVFAAPVSLGTVGNLEREMGAALAGAHAEALAAVRAAPVKHADETGWKRAGKLCWLWAAATATVAAFVVHARRGARGLAALLGEEIGGVLCSDRWSAYARVPAGRRQVCWAHLKRDFRKVVDRGGPAATVGRVGLRVVKKVFERWHLFRGGGCTREELQAVLEPLELRLNRALLEGAILADDAKVARFCENVLAVEAGLWTFARVEGVEPTNNHMERLLRRAVLWRRRSFGSWSEAGCRFVERVLTAVQTLRLQQRSVLAYLTDALSAHRDGLPAPQLLPNG